MVIATALGLTWKNGVVLSADRRVSYGDGYILSKSVRKVFKVNDQVGVAFAGIPADFQALIDSLKFNVRLYELDTGRRAHPTNVARLLSIILYGRRLSLPYYASMIVGGIEEGVPRLYALDPAGSSLEDKYSAVGSGARLAMGILDRQHRADLTSEEALNIAEGGVRAAIQRDALSGDGVDLLLITPEKTVEKFVPVKLA